MVGVDPDKNGLKTVIAQAHDAGQSPPESMDGEQMALLPIKSIHLQPENTGGNISAARGVGRPPGSRNKNTKEWRDFILSRYSSPLVALAETMSRPVHDLAVEFGYTKIGDHGAPLRNASPDEVRELFKIQMTCAKELLPYLHQKQPQALEVGEGGLMTLNIFSAPAGDVMKAPEFSIDIIDFESDENQGVSDEGGEKLNGEELNAIKKDEAL